MYYHVEQNLCCVEVWDGVVRGCITTWNRTCGVEEYGDSAVRGCITTWNKTCGVAEYETVWLGDVLPRGTEPAVWKSMGRCG